MKVKAVVVKALGGPEGLVFQDIALDPNSDPADIKVADADFDGINLQRHDVHGDWTYTISPRSDSWRFWSATGP